MKLVRYPTAAPVRIGISQAVTQPGALQSPALRSSGSAISSGSVAQLTGRMICSAERRSRSLPFIVRLRRYRLVFGARSTRPRLTGAVRFSCGVTAGKPPASSSASSSMSLLARVFP